MAYTDFAAVPRGRYQVILADPPWRYQTWSHRGQGKGAVQHYPTMPTPEICAMEIAPLAAKDCTLFLWGTWPHLPDALQVIGAWGFAYVSLGFIWMKLNAKAPVLWCDAGDAFLGPGYVTRGNSEFCLRGRRGAPKRKGSSGPSQLICAEEGTLLSPRREHSRKPDEQYELIEAVYDGPYLELFSRTARPGWDAWGNQLGKFAAPPARRTA